MAKRYTDTTIWKKQRWFRKLSAIHKLAWKYLTDNCDHAGIMKIDFSELIDDLGVDEFDVKDFIAQCNIEYDKENGEKVKRERIKLLEKNTIWLTGFIKFQYENKEFMINPKIPAIHSALTILNGYSTLNEGLVKGYFTLSQPYTKGMLRTKDKDKDNVLVLEEKEDKKKLEYIISQLENIEQKISEEDKINFMHLVVEMSKMFIEKNPQYHFHKETDYSACLQIAYHIAQMKNWRKAEVINGKMKETIESWTKITDFIKADNWLSTRSLTDLSTVKEWQRLVQKMTTTPVSKDPTKIKIQLR